MYTCVHINMHELTVASVCHYKDCDRVVLTLRACSGVHW